MKTRPLGNSGLHASVVGLGTWVLGGGAVWGEETDDRESIHTIQAALDAGINLIDTAPAYGWGRSEEIVGKAIKSRHDKVVLTGKVGLDRVFGKDEFRSNEAWNPWYLAANRRRVLDLLDGWRGLTRQYQCTIAQLVIAWTATQPGVTHVLCGARHVGQAKENAAAGNLALAPEDILRMRHDVEALGEPIHEAAEVTA